MGTPVNRRSPSEQAQRFGPAFQRLSDVLSRDPSGLALRTDPAALAPERLLVFEVEGSVQNFAAAVRRIEGLEFADEEELATEPGQAAPTVYLLIPDARALAELLSLWRRWQVGERFDPGFTPWRDVFAQLRDLRPWGPRDRVTEDDRTILAEEADEMTGAALVRLEIELVFRSRPDSSGAAEAALATAIAQAGGRILHRSRIESIAYQAVLAELPGREVLAIADRAPGSIAGLDAVMYVRPQAVSFSLEVADVGAMEVPPQPDPGGSPIAAILDGVPVSEHPLLARRLRVEDVFGYESTTLVAQRRHGTAMASLVVHGDRNQSEPALPRPVAVVPVMSWDGYAEVLQQDRLIVDLIHTAVRALRAPPEPLAPDIVLVNVSLGNLRRPFQGQVSPWARLLDRLSWEFGILFVVSAGNASDRFVVPAFDSTGGFEAASPTERATASVRAVAAVQADRRIIAPGETVNNLTIGACNLDAVSTADRASSRFNLDPYPGLIMGNPSSRLGPGFANAVKPDALMPGGREHVRPVLSGGGLEVQPAGAARAFGLRVAAPSAAQAPVEHFTNGTSAAAALASRTCHLIHDALEAAYGMDFLSLPTSLRAVCLKALFAHGARWPLGAADLIRDAVGPADPRQHVRQKDNIRRFLGYGVVDGSAVVACAADRATCWAVGSLGPEAAVRIDFPIPMCLNGQALPHEVLATLAWFTPILPGRRSYRTVRLDLQQPGELPSLGVDSAASQPDGNQTRRGTLISRRWEGHRAPVVTPEAVVSMVVQRNPDQGAVIDELVPFALAVTLGMPGVVSLYDEVRARVAIRPQTRV